MIDDTDVAFTKIVILGQKSLKSISRGGRSALESYLYDLGLAKMFMYLSKPMTLLPDHDKYTGHI